MIMKGRRAIPWITKSVLNPSWLNLPLQCRWASILFERRKNSIRKEKSRASRLSAVLSCPRCARGIDFCGDTHLIPTDDHCRERRKAPGLPDNLPWRKHLPGLELPFSWGLFMKSRVTLLGNELPFIPCLNRPWRQSPNLKLLQSVARPPVPGARCWRWLVGR